MAKRLVHMTWDEVQQEMSIAGSPEKITQLGGNVLELIGKTINVKNRAELTNAEFMLKRVMAEIKGEQRRYDSSHKY